MLFISWLVATVAVVCELVKSKIGVSTKRLNKDWCNVARLKGKKNAEVVSGAWCSASKEYLPLDCVNGGRPRISDLRYSLCFSQ